MKEAWLHYGNARASVVNEPRRYECIMDKILMWLKSIIIR